MSSASSVVTYTSIYTDSKPGRVFWGADEELLDDGPPRVIIYGYDRLPMQPILISRREIQRSPEDLMRQRMSMFSPPEGNRACYTTTSTHIATFGARINVRTSGSISPSPEGRGLRYEIRKSSTARPIGGQGIDYGFFSTVDAEARR
ncbi:hypothetical protein Tco_0179802 [Tanacetum coccineum]